MRRKKYADEYNYRTIDTSAWHNARCVFRSGGWAVVLLAAWLTPILPYMLSFAAGAMCYVVVEELIPEASSGEHSNLSTIGFAIGFVLMMVLDVVMG